MGLEIVTFTGVDTGTDGGRLADTRGRRIGVKSESCRHR